MATAAIVRMSRLLKIRSISFPTKYRLYNFFVVFILLYGCDTWTLNADTERRILACEHKYLQRLLSISFREHKTN